MSNAKAFGTPMSLATSLDKDEEGKPVDESKYCGMIGSLLYLTASCPDLIFNVCRCARFQAAPKESHLTTVKQIIKYLIGTTPHGLWYPHLKIFKLQGFLDADLAGDKDDRKSTSGTCQLLGKSLISLDTIVSMDYVAMDCTWIKKQEIEAKMIPSSSKVKVDTSQATVNNLELLAKIDALDEKLTTIKDLLLTTQSLVGNIYEVVKET
uniref:Uncharacterized mitochondrial protein AtMg00810-like n=1 Tax=Nicotiana tabacum TaxID=4097 RepID=A0A1S4CXA2_TOBAC|nr:PREDICTED: uncharacterized mitochondrial protein AtMg00810-like [Nicotiana tabacum]